jgi:hypothetical protein
MFARDLSIFHVFKGQKAWLVSELLQTEDPACLSWWMNLYGRKNFFAAVAVADAAELK